VESLVPFQPFLNVRMFMGRVVVDNQMQVQIGGRLGVEPVRNLVSASRDS
jgi:hypothetical protein